MGYLANCTCVKEFALGKSGFRENRKSLRTTGLYNIKRTYLPF